MHDAAPKLMYAESASPLSASAIQRHLWMVKAKFGARR